MFFQITPPDGRTEVEWVYLQGTEKNPGDAVCRSYGTFRDEAAARSDIALTKRRMAASRMAAVASPKETE